MADHLHMFFGLKPHQSISNLMMLVKGESSEWINNQKFTFLGFPMARGLWAFSYARSQVKAVAAYLENQEQHHRKKNFLEEYKDMLDKFEIEYDERYVFISKIPCLNLTKTCYYCIELSCILLL
jgi:hypothetical protein